jgi:outer membrane protein
MTRHVTLLAAAAWLLGAPATNAQEPVNTPAPLSLEQAVRDTLSQNPALLAAKSGAEAAGETATATRSSLYPRVSFTESWQRGDQPVFVFSSLLSSSRFAASNFAIDALNHPDPVGYFHGVAAIEQVIYDGGIRSATTDNARAQQRIADLSARQAALALVANVTDLYGRLLAQDAARRTSAAALDAGREDLARATRRRDVGVATEADVLSLTVHVADMEQRVIQADGDAAILRAQLNRLMGAPVDRRFEPVEPATAGAPTPEMRALLAEAESQRPEIQRAAAAEEIADTSRRAARSAYIPKVAAQAALDLSGTTFADRASSWLVGGEFRWSLGLGGAEHAQVKAAAASMTKARAEAQDTRAQVQVEVVTALQQLQSARARQAVGRAAVAQARESERIIRDRYNAGLAPVNDVLRAASAVLDAESQRVSALVDAVTGAARLASAVGRLP